MSYTLEELKAAFTKVFLHAGELWFPYPTGAEEIGFESVESTWQEFVEVLNGEVKMKNNGKWYDHTWRG